MRLLLKVTTGLAILVLIFSSRINAIIPDLEPIKNERSLSNPSYVLGQHWFRKLNASNALIDFPPAYDYLKHTLSQILPQTSLYNKTVEMTLLNSSKSNAFVIPGNHLFIYSDMMGVIRNEDMLIGLLAHEIAHLDLKHFERRKDHANEESNKTLTLIGASIAAALAGASSDITTALWIGSIANQTANNLSYSRQQEQEADRQGRQYLTEAGLSSDGIQQLFQAFLKKALGQPRIEFLSTHPSPDTRLADTFNTGQKKTILFSRRTQEFEYFRATMLAYRAGLEELPYAFLDQYLHDEETNAFAKALLSYLNQSPEKSIELLDKIQQHNPFTRYLQAISYESQGSNTQALDIINNELDIAPDNVLFSMLHAQLSLSKPENLQSDFLYENRLMWRANIQYYQSIRNIPLALSYQALLEFSQGKNKIANMLITRAYREAKESEKSDVKSIMSLFEKIEAAEEQEGLNDT